MTFAARFGAEARSSAGPIKALAALLAGTSLLALSGVAFAATDTATAQADPAASATSSEVIVTGSRVIRNGNASPTPLTVANAQQLKLLSPINLSNGIAELPAFQNSGPGRTTSQTISSTAGNFLNLRSLGNLRTLVLIDGLRMPATTYTGLVDVDIMPEMLVSRLDVVTGGASAAYGSDAVAGAVNYILDTKFTGFKLEASAGESNYHGYRLNSSAPGGGIGPQLVPTNCCDGGSYRVGGAAGFSLMDGRLHLLAAAEFTRSNPVLMYSRPYMHNDWWLYVPLKPVSAGAFGSAANPYFLRYTVVNISQAYTPKFISGPPGIINTWLTPGGQVLPWDNGTATGSTILQIGGSGLGQDENRDLIPGLEQTHMFAGVSFDVTPTLNAWAQVIYGRNITKNDQSQDALQSNPIFSGNPYLPASVQAIMTATNTASVNIAESVAQSVPLYGRETTNDLIVLAGLKGDLFASWKFDINYSYGRASDFNVNQQPNLPARYAALDAVVNPANGQVVCRVALTNPGLYPGCAPFNPFGLDSISADALGYIMQLDWYRSAFVTNDVTLNVNGDFFHTWAGPIRVAAGFEYRTRSLAMTSNGDPNILPSTTGIRGIPAGTKKWFFLSVAPVNGSDNVKEGYFEAEIPLARDMPFAHSLDLNGAVRVADYSLSGIALSYKVGGVWAPVEDIRIRGTISRDVRAPVLSELFGLTQSNSSVQQDPHCSCQGSFTTVTGGNPNLKPEFAQTFTGGAVFQPHQVRNLSLSVDWYSIAIDDVIAVPSTSNVLQLCFNENGVGPDCKYVVYPLGYANTTSANFPTQVIGVQQNLSRLSTSGVDIEANYSFDLNDVMSRLRGAISVRALVNYVANYTVQQTAQSNPINVAGFTNDASSFGPIPHWKALFTVDYQNGGFDWLVSTRLVGPLTVGPTFTYVPNQVPAIVYVNTTISYTTKIAGAKTQFFFTVNNLFNQIYPLVPTTSQPGIQLPTVQGPLYDLMLRYFSLGVKTRF